MSWIPAFEIGVWNAWLFMIVYPLQWMLVLILPRHIVERTSHAPGIARTRHDRILLSLNSVLWVAASLYSIFLPLHMGTAWFYIGLCVFIAGVIILVAATLEVIRATDDKPFTTGIYRFSRHPMYLSMILVYLGVSIAAASWLFFLITVATYFLQRYQMIKEEEYCCRKYGQSYIDYMGRTRRWIGW